MNLPLSYNADASTNNFLLTPNGDVGPRPFSPYFGGNYSVYFDGATSTRLTLASSSDFAFGTGAYTIEAWVYLAAYASNGNVIFDTGNASSSLYFTVGSSGALAIGKQGTGYLITSANSVVALNTWVHVAISRSSTSSNDTRLFVNGVFVAVGTDSNNWTVTTTPTIGGINASGYTTTGYISNLSVLKGTAKYTTNFTPTAQALPTGTTNQVLLACASNRFIDTNTATTAKAITVNGDSRITDNSPFVSTDFTTGAGYFDGTTDYLNGATNTATAFNLTGDFTIEMWIYCTDIAASPSGGQGFISWSDSSGWNGWQVYHVSGSLKFEFLTGSTGAGSITSSTITNSQWVHIAVVRSGTSTNNINFYVNGTANGSASYNSSQTSASSFIKIGTDRTVTNYLRGYIAGLRVVNGTAVYTGNFSPPSLANLGRSGATSIAAYPSTTNVNTSFAESATSLLTLQTRAPSQNINFIDSSPNEFIVTKNGNTTQGTFSPFSPTGWGNYFDGSSYLSLSNGAALAAGTSNFTAEFWVYATTDQQSQAYGAVFHVGSGTSGAFAISLLYSSAGLMKIRIGTAAVDYDSTSTISTNRWYHIAVVREGTGSNQTKIYVDGSLFYTFTLSDNLSNSSGLYVGSTGFNLSVRRLSGYVSNLRYTVGTALYTTAFTPSTSPLTTTSQGATASQVELLTCQNNRFLDNSSNGWTFTTSGSPSVQAFSPFAPANAVSPLVTGGSGYFDGTGDTLSVGSASNWTFLHNGSSDFTIQFWIYPTLTNTNLLANGYDSTVSHGFIVDLGAGTSGQLRYLFLNASGSVASFSSNASVVTLNQWNYCAFTFTSSTKTGVWYVNGASAGSTTNTGFSYSATAPAYPLIVADRPAGTAPEYQGYISGLRITNSVVADAVSIPTTPPTAIPNTSLLLNFTNGAAVDATGKNNLESVGKTQLSKVQAKWNNGTGGSSLQFDGSGYLVSNAASTDLYAFGSGEFTIEFWVYFNTVTGVQEIYDARPFGASGKYPTIYTSAGTIYYYTDSANRITGSTLSAGTWYHIALARSGTDTKLFVDGTQSGSTYTSDTNVYLNGAGRPCIGADGTTYALPFNGYLSNLRVTKGKARYTSNFNTNLPTGPFPIG